MVLSRAIRAPPLGTLARPLASGSEPPSRSQVSPSASVPSTIEALASSASKATKSLPGGCTIAINRRTSSASYAPLAPTRGPFERVTPPR